MVCFLKRRLAINCNAPKKSNHPGSITKGFSIKLFLEEAQRQRLHVQNVHYVSHHKTAYFLKGRNGIWIAQFFPVIHKHHRFCLRSQNRLQSLPNRYY